MPSMYFSSSHASRLLPMPALPTNDTSRARRSRPVALSSSLSRWNSLSRPTNGGSSTAARPAPPRPARIAMARQASTPSRLPLRSCSPTGSAALGGRAARGLADEHRSSLGDALQAGGRVDEIAADHALAGGAQVDRGLAGHHGPTGLESETRIAGVHPLHVDDEIQRGPHRALGGILAGDRPARVPRARRQPHGGEVGAAGGDGLSSRVSAFRRLDAGGSAQRGVRSRS